MNKFRLNLYKYCSIALVAVFFLSACATNTNKPLKKSYANNFSAVASKKNKFKPLANQAFSWRREIILLNEDSTVNVTPDSIAFIRSSIEQQLSLKNYKVQSASTKTDYYIAAAIILDDSNVSKKITDFAKLYPGLSSSLSDNQKGNLILIVFDKIVDSTDTFSESNVLWKGSIQAFVAEESMTLEQRRKRLNKFISLLMLEFPVGT